MSATSDEWKQGIERGAGAEYIYAEEFRRAGLYAPDQQDLGDRRADHLVLCDREEVRYIVEITTEQEISQNKFDQVKDYLDRSLDVTTEKAVILIVREELIETDPALSALEEYAATIGAELIVLPLFNVEENVEFIKDLVDQAQKDELAAETADRHENEPVGEQRSDETTDHREHDHDTAPDERAASDPQADRDEARPPDPEDDRERDQELPPDERADSDGRQDQDERPAGHADEARDDGDRDQRPGDERLEPDNTPTIELEADSGSNSRHVPDDGSSAAGEHAPPATGEGEAPVEDLAAMASAVEEVPLVPTEQPDAPGEAEAAVVDAETDFMLDGAVDVASEAQALFDVMIEFSFVSGTDNDDDSASDSAPRDDTADGGDAT